MIRHKRKSSMINSILYDKHKHLFNSFHWCIVSCIPFLSCHLKKMNLPKIHHRWEVRPGVMLTLSDLADALMQWKPHTDPCQELQIKMLSFTISKCCYNCSGSMKLVDLMYISWMILNKLILIAVGRSASVNRNAWRKLSMYNFQGGMNIVKWDTGTCQLIH